MKIKTLKQCLSLIIDHRGLTPKKLKSTWSNSGYKVLSANNVKTVGISNLDKVRYIDEYTYKNWMKIEIQRGDILLTSEAPVGEVYYWDSEEKIATGQRVYGLRTNAEVNSLYLKYYIQSNIGQNEIKKFTSGSTVSGISAETFEYIKVCLPDNLSDQIKIGEALYTIDELIINNDNIIQQLEIILKTIYDFWFLQFEFPNDEGAPYKSSGGKMIWNEDLQCEIPEGWYITTINDFAEVNKGSYITEKQANLNGSYKVVSAGLDFAYYHDDFNREENTISISASGANAGFVNFWYEKIFANDCITIRGKELVETTYIFNFLKHIQDHLYSQTNRSAQSHIYPDDIKKLKLVIPTSDVMKKYNHQIKNYYSYIKVLKEQNKDLLNLREFLLPILINGQVTINTNKQ